MEYSIRTYHQQDLLAVLHLLNTNLDYDTFTENMLLEKLEGDPFWNPEKTFICQDGKQIIGFMQGVIRDIRGTRYGYIKLMAVENDYRRLGIAGTMFSKLESQFKAERVDIIRIYDVPMNYFMPGIDPRYTPAVCFAIRMGFKRFGDTSNLTVNLSSSDWNTAQEEKVLKNQGIEISRPETKERQEVINFVEEEWALWKNEVDMAFRDDPPSIHIARLHGKIKAFSAHNGNNKGTGWFGPMGTHADLRGKGIGGILLKRCLFDIKAMDLKAAIIPWVGPIDFYAHHANAKVDRVFWRYEKQLKS